MGMEDQTQALVTINPQTGETMDTAPIIVIASLDLTSPMPDQDTTMASISPKIIAQS